MPVSAPSGHGVVVVVVLRDGPGRALHAVQRVRAPELAAVAALEVPGGGGEGGRLVECLQDIGYRRNVKQAYA